jgi:chemotaxis protein methyltransferase CheR
MRTIAETARAILGDGSFPALRDHAVFATGLEYYTGRTDSFAEQVAHRLCDLGLTDCDEYLELLHDGKAGETELDNLIVRLTVGETHFFRHRELFDGLRDAALPEILNRNRESKRLRIWSAGCSTGAEAYSLSILLRREMPFSLDDWDVSIVGTDINRPFLSQASTGQYEEWAFRGTTLQFRRECFEEVVSGKTWRIAPKFQQGVTFQYHNLVRHPFPSLANNLIAFDIILCRNVLIYFAPDVAERTILQLSQCLVPGGWLAVGHAENGGHYFDEFDTVNLQGATLHRKPMSARRPSAEKCAQPSLSRPSVLLGNSALDSVAALSSARKSPRCQGYTVKSRCKPQVPSTDLAIDRIRSLSDRGDMNGALALCRIHTTKEPLNPVLHFYSGLLLDQVARYSAAAEALGRAVYLDREFVLAHYYLGLVRQKLSDAPGAVKSFRNVTHLLEGLDQTVALPNSDGLSASDLSQLTSFHLEHLNSI